MSRGAQAPSCARPLHAKRCHCRRRCHWHHAGEYLGKRYVADRNLRRVMGRDDDGNADAAADKSK